MYAIVLTGKRADDYSFNICPTLEEAKELASEITNYLVQKLAKENNIVPVPQIILKEEYIRLWHSYNATGYDIYGDYTDIRIYDMSQKTVFEESFEELNYFSD